MKGVPFHGEQRNDPFDGRFNEAREALAKVLQSQYTGRLADALHLGSTAMQAFRILDGTHDVTELSYRVTTTNDVE